MKINKPAKDTGSTQKNTPRRSSNQETSPQLEDKDEIIRQLIEELQQQAPLAYEFKEISDLRPVKKLMDWAPELQIDFVRKTIDTAAALGEKLGKPNQQNAHLYMNLCHQEGFPRSCVVALRQLLRRSLPFTTDDFVYMLKRTADLEMVSIWSVPYLENLVSRLETHLSDEAPSDDLRQHLARLRDALGWIANAPERKLVIRISRLIEGPSLIPLQRGEAWSDQVFADIEKMTKKLRGSWIGLLNHCLESSGGRPNPKWLTTAKLLLTEVGQDELCGRIQKWFPLIERPRTDPLPRPHEGAPDPNWLITDSNADIVKGLVWMCASFDAKEVARSVTNLALTSYKKLPGVGPRAVKIGNACIYSLGEMPGNTGLAQLAVLKVRVRFRPALKGIEKALESTARRLGVTALELEEMSIPTYGLDDTGSLRTPLGEFEMELRIAGSRSTEVTWKNQTGEIIKSLPSSVKQKYPDELKDAKVAAKDIQSMLSAQRDRLDSLFIQQRSWAYDVWHERYFRHPLMGSLARHLIWRFTLGDSAIDAMLVNGTWMDSGGKSTKAPDSQHEVALWHPIGNSVQEIVAWRWFIEEHDIRQPFKQAHREVYLLTDAERQTATYSNRYAGHVVKQHQFNSLCAARTWRNVLKLMVDQDFPPASLSLPKWNLRAEFWTDGAGNEYGEDTNETGTYYRLTTDQVRFLPIAAPQTTWHPDTRGQQRTVDPIPLEQVHPLVFSEVMRDIDLFVGVSSVGNDPTWSDGGPNGRYREYWQSYSFGDLSATAQTRKEILQGLIPRLKISSQCTFEDKFLIVRGNLRTYKIHLGSSNILMTPNDQYLCIVQSRGSNVSGDKLYLPFEGDNTLSLILSKALLLANDTAISDPSILNQIKLN